MDSLQFYGDHLDENEGAEEESPQLQPDFSVNDVEIEVVSVVVETQELEVEEVVTFEKSTVDGDNDFPYVEGRNDLGSNNIDGEFADPKVIPEAEEGPQAVVPIDQVPKLVDLNRNTRNNDLNFTDTGGDELMAEQDEAPLEGGTEAMEATDDVTTILQQTEADGEHAVTSGGVANGESGVALKSIEMDACDHQLSLEPATEPVTAVLDDGLPVEDSLKVPADLAENKAIVNEDANENETQDSEHLDTQAISNEDANENETQDSEHLETQAICNEDANENETQDSEHLDTQAICNEDANEKQTDVSEHADSGRKQTDSHPEDVNKSDDDSMSAGDSATSKEILSDNVDLGSVFAPEQLFNDASLAQLKAQILVMGILRKGSKPSDGLLNSACPTRSEGTPSATVAEDVDNAGIGGPTPGDPSSSRKRKSLDTETIPVDNDVIATGLMMAVKDNLHLSPTRDVFLLDDTDRQLRSAQISAHDAMATATSALAQSHLAWAQIRCEDHSASGIAREQQIASVAATIAAAASVAKAAVEAAKAIANVSIKAFVRGGQIVSGQSTGKGKSKSLPTRRKSDMLASVVKAAGMAAEAATQAGTVLTFANPLIPAGGMEGLWTREAGEAGEADAQAYRAVKKKSKVPLRTKATKKSKGRVPASPKRAPFKVLKSGSRKKNEASKPSRTRKDNRQPASPAKSIISLGDSVEARDVGDINEKSEFIVKGSVVEIITDEEGLRGGWFSGKISKVTKGQALAVYDELLDDDGFTKIQEWLPFKASGDPAGPRRQVRPVHPYSSMRETGSRKRRRVAMGSQTWTLGDRVDAYIQDAWWEGELVELNDIDESKATVYFPGENDTQVVKVWDLRPSMQWEDGKWVPWANSVTEQDEPPKMQGKAGSSSSKAKDKSITDNVPKLTAKTSKAKENPKKVLKKSPKITQDISAKAVKAMEIPKKTEDLSKEVGGTLPSRSTRQATVQRHSANVPKVKTNAKNIQVSVTEVDDPTPSTSTRKRKGHELSASDDKGKKKPRVLEDPVDVPASTRPTRSSLRDATTSTKDTGGKLSTEKLSDQRTSSGKKTMDTSKASQKTTSTLGKLKKLDLNVNTRSSAKTSSPSNVTTTNTRGKLKAEAENKRPRRR